MPRIKKPRKRVPKAELSNSVERSEVCKTNGDVGFDDVCERCRSIPWHELPGRDNKISTTPREPDCRMCRWFAEFGCTHISKGYRYKSLYSYPAAQRLWAWKDESSPGSWDVVVCDRTTQLQSLTRPFISFSRLKDLLETCAEQHTDCSLHRQDHVIPHLRVINCTTREVVNAPINCEYVALSYVWGSVQSFNDDLASMQNLPLVIEQSIAAASKLGFNFLWVDRYCINQKDKQHKDNQILQMSAIYRSAQLTIIAAAGQDPTHGLPGVKPNQRSPVHRYHETLGSVCLSALPRAILDGDAYFDGIRKTVWASRAWTFQESMFSRRRLLFTESQVIFSCDTSTRCEWGRELRNDDGLLSILPWCGTRELLGLPLRPACEIMERYCKRSLTHDIDALNAIASTLNFVQESDEYHIWGVPFRVCKSSSDETQRAVSIPYDAAELLESSDVQMVEIYLSWYHSRPCSRRQGFPSWSPLGWSPGSVYYDGTYQGPVFVDTPRGKESLSTHLQCAKSDPAGMAQHISLLLRTRFVTVCKHDFSRHMDHMDTENGILVPLGQGFAYMMPIKWDRHVGVDCEMKIAIIPSSRTLGVGMVHFIVLQAHDGYYERIGWSGYSPERLKTWARDGLLLSSRAATRSRRRNVRWKAEKFTPILLSEDGKFRPLDEERLRAAFGDIDKEELWYEQDGFQEEYITLG